jgi:membrane-associated phospholipid phosphatase
MAQTVESPPKVPAIFRRCQAWDDKWLLRLNAKQETRFTKFVELFSFCGRMEVWLLLAVSFVVIWYLPLAALYLGLNLGWGISVVYLCKVFVNRPRPFRMTPGVRVLEGPNTSASFPSWHAYVALSGVLAIYALVGHWGILVAGIPFAAAVGWSRPFLGVHYPTDIIGGWVIGIFGFWASAAVAPLLLPFVRLAMDATTLPLVEGVWSPLATNWVSLVVIIAIYVAVLAAFIFLRKKKKAKVTWR